MIIFFICSLIIFLCNFGALGDLNMPTANQNLARMDGQVKILTDISIATHGKYPVYSFTD